MNNPMFPAESHIIAEDDDAPTIPQMRVGVLIFPDRSTLSAQDEIDSARFATFSDDDDTLITCTYTDDSTDVQTIAHDDLHSPTSGWID